MTQFLKDTKKIVGCDLDDVLADFMKRFMSIGSQKYGIDPNARPTTWEWDGADLNPERVDGIWSEIIATPNFWETLDVLPGVDGGAIRRLDRDTKLYFPTARAVTSDGVDIGLQSARWLRKKFCVEFPSVFVSSEKGPLAAALKYDYFIDDRPKNCTEVKLARPECKVFLQNSSHNQGVVLPEIPRIASINDFVEIVLKGE